MVVRHLQGCDEQQQAELCSDIFDVFQEWGSGIFFLFFFHQKIYQHDPKMTRVRRKRVHTEKKHEKKLHRTRRRTKDLDQIHQDLANKDKWVQQALDSELPGMGQFYCVECAKYCISQTALETHQASKLHKKRLKDLKDGPYTQADAEAAIGLTTENKRTTTSMDTSSS